MPEPQTAVFQESKACFPDHTLQKLSAGHPVDSKEVCPSKGSFCIEENYIGWIRYSLIDRKANATIFSAIFDNSSRRFRDDALTRSR
jgi:hypothetical protein